MTRGWAGVVLLAGLLGPWVPPAARAGGLEDLDPGRRRALVDAARAYLDPASDALAGPRSRLLAALEAAVDPGVDPLGDLELLRGVVSQGRGFRAALEDPRPRRGTGASLRPIPDLSGFALRTEDLDLVLLPPRERRHLLDRVPRPDPLPLLVVLHTAEDGGDPAAALRRRHPRLAGGGGGRRDWVVLAPRSPDGRFTEPDGSIRHGLLTSPLREVWQRYHVDFDRIVLDGGPDAAAFAAAFPNVLAGLVLRRGPVATGLVGNYANVPTYVVADETLARDLGESGHPDVTLGPPADLEAWLDARRRAPVREFAFRAPGSADSGLAHWIHWERGAPGAEVRLEVSCASEGEVGNTIRVSARGVSRLTLFLNDDLVDLDRAVRLVVNGEVRHPGLLERSLERLFERTPEVRRTMYFGWLYPAVLAGVDVPPPPSSEEPDGPSSAADALREQEAAALWLRGREAEIDGDPAAARARYREILALGHTAYLDRVRARLDALARVDVRLEAQYAFLLGRPDRLEALLGVPSDAVGAYAFALRDLWWRAGAPPERQARYVAAAGDASGLLARQYAWLLGGGEGPYPEPAVGEEDPWPVLTTLVLDRLQRERKGRRGLPRTSPLALRPPPPAWRDWYPGWRDYFLGEVMAGAYLGPDAVPATDEDRARRRAARERAERRRSRNALLAALAVALFLGAALLLGRRIGPPEAGLRQ